jgi:hypothetical protein
VSTLTADARATFRAERRPDMTERERVGLAFSSARVATEARRNQAHHLLDVCRAEYGRSFELVMRDPTNMTHRHALLRAARRYRLVTWVLVGHAAAQRLTAWRLALRGEWLRAEWWAA